MAELSIRMAAGIEINPAERCAVIEIAEFNPGTTSLAIDEMMGARLRCRAGPPCARIVSLCSAAVRRVRYLREPVANALVAPCNPSREISELVESHAHGALQY